MEIQMTSPFSESALRALLAQLPDGIVLTDRSGGFVYVNDVAGRLLEELTTLDAGNDRTGLPAWGAGTRRPLPIDSAVARAIVIGEVVRDEEIACVTRDGHRRWVSASATPVCGATDEMEAVVVTFADVTARKERDAFAPIMETLARL